MSVQDLSVKPSTDALFSGSSRGSRRNMGQFIRWALLFGGGILMIMPIIFMLSTSLKFPFEVYNLNLVPEEPTIENYTYVLEDGRFFHWFWNSLIIATLTTISAVFFDALVGYALCKFKFPGRYLIFIAILATVIVSEWVSAKVRHAII